MSSKKFNPETGLVLAGVWKNTFDTRSISEIIQNHDIEQQLAIQMIENNHEYEGFLVYIGPELTTEQFLQAVNKIATGVKFIRGKYINDVDNLGPGWRLASREKYAGSPLVITSEALDAGLEMYRGLKSKVSLNKLNNEEFGRLRTAILAVTDDSFNSLRNLVLANELPALLKDSDPNGVTLDEIQFLIQVLGKELVEEILIVDETEVGKLKAE